jgi:Na+-transporting methylmalonyl-CoA/oxaloacetate decarboxylase beta subunit
MRVSTGQKIHFPLTVLLLVALFLPAVELNLR